MIKILEEALKELDEIARKYQGLARQERRFWDYMKLGTEDLDKIRSKLIFYTNAINAFTSSLSRGTLAQIETVLFELVSEVRRGRRQPSLASLHETNKDSVWSELESELARDGILSTDIAKHKAAIKIYIQGLLDDPKPDSTSSVEATSLLDSGKRDTNSEYPSRLGLAPELSPQDPVESVTPSDSNRPSVDGKEYKSADEELLALQVGARSFIVEWSLY